MKVEAGSHIGLCRKLNEDRVFYSLEKIGIFDNLFILCDGMGGENAGDYASLKAIEYIVDYLKNNLSEELVVAFKEAIDFSNNKLLQEARQDFEKTGMGTTLVLATIKDNILYVANIGDSRLYILEQGEFIQITKDHNVSEELLALHKVDKDSEKYRKYKNRLTRALGAIEDMKADFFEVSLDNVDRVLLCSDGLTNMLSDEEIKLILEKSLAKKTVYRLIDEANERGGKDNISAILIYDFDTNIGENHEY